MLPQELIQELPVAVIHVVQQQIHVHLVLLSLWPKNDYVSSY
jgi:hypothetical protein